MQDCAHFPADVTAGSEVRHYDQIPVFREPGKGRISLVDVARHVRNDPVLGRFLIIPGANVRLSKISADHKWIKDPDEDPMKVL